MCVACVLMVCLTLVAPGPAEDFIPDYECPEVKEQHEKEDMNELKDFLEHLNDLAEGSRKQYLPARLPDSLPDSLPAVITDTHPHPSQYLTC